MKARRSEWFSRSFEYFFSLRFANILPRVFLKEQICESSIKEGPHREMRALKSRILTD